MKSLDIIAQETDKINFRSLIKTLRIDLESGKTLHQCLQRHPHLFDPFCCQLIHIGEQTGTLEHALASVALYKEKNHQLTTQFRQACIYPGIILITALITTLLLLLCIVPQFAALLAHFPHQLPLATRVLIQFAEGLRQRLPSLTIFFTVSFFAFFHIRNTANQPTRCQQFMFHCPYLNHLVLKATLIKFSRHLAATLSAGLPLTEALMLTSQLSPIVAFKNNVLKIYAGVHSGKPLSTNLQHIPLFPSLLVQMVKIGEESGTLNRMLEKFSEIYQRDLEQRLAILKLVLEPLIIAILGVLIGGIVIIMYLPIFSLGTAIA